MRAFPGKSSRATHRAAMPPIATDRGDQPDPIELIKAELNTRPVKIP